MGPDIHPVHLIFKNNVERPHWVLWSGLGFWCLSPVVSVTALWTTAASPSTPPWSNSVDTDEYRQWCDNVQSGTLHPSWRQSSRPHWAGVTQGWSNRSEANVRSAMCEEELEPWWTFRCEAVPLLPSTACLQNVKLHPTPSKSTLFHVSSKGGFVNNWVFTQHAFCPCEVTVLFFLPLLIH